MGTRAIVGVEHADGTYQARIVGLDGYPTVIVPFLAELVHITCDGDQRAALAALLRTDWLTLGRETTTPAADDPASAIGTPTYGAHQVMTGRITKDLAGDREWAYLFTDEDLLAVYRAIPVRLTRQRWKPWATWKVADLPQVALAELDRIQRTGIAEARDAADFLTYMAAARRAFREERR